ncbi:MAG TPA: PadR family transcriptional regulator [Bryobacteraceae bacterium]|jgi:DNA-binding PadR family transcriptional regulator|nr:PadR family transcriptional regulator [Bryobacteraceae bacterium]
MAKNVWGFGRVPGFAPFVFGGRNRFFESGEVRLAVLSLLSEAPKHGYQLMKEMRERSNGAYRASAGSVYPTLQQLEDEELIASDQEQGRRVYHLTKAGKRELEKEAPAVREIWERAEECSDWGGFVRPDTMGLWGHMTALMKSAFKASTRASGSGGGYAQAERVREVLDRARRELERL